MKRLVLLGVGLCLLTACAAKEEIRVQETVSQVSELTEESVASKYDQIVQAYEAAAMAETVSEGEFPQLNLASLDLARRYTGDGDLDIVSKRVDLNQDGQDELLIGTKTPSGEQEIAVYTGAYGLVNGQVVDLLADLLTGQSDSFTVFYQNNRMRLDLVTEDAEVATVLYELTDQGFKELLYLSTDLTGELDEQGQFYALDREGNRYDSGSQEAKVLEVLGHGFDQEVVE